MTQTRKAFTLLAAGTLAVLSLRAEAQTARPLLHPLFSDHMVLQRERTVPVWGWAEPGAPITVVFAGRSATTTAQPDGKWMVRLPAMKAGGPHTLRVTDTKRSQNVRDVLMGDVWVGSGQSNMEMGMANIQNAEAEIAAANDPQLRLFSVPRRCSYDPQELVNGQWSVCTPQTLRPAGSAGFSATAYFFGRELRKALKVPIGLIHTSWGGTPAEVWISEEGLRTQPDFREGLDNLARQRYAQRLTTFEETMARWWQTNDPDTEAMSTNLNLDTSAWKTMNAPGYWEDSGAGTFDGIGWFRKEFDAPASVAGKALTLRLGPVDDQDVTWINGVKVGEGTLWNQARVYSIPAGVVKPGRNVISMRLLDVGYAGGFAGPAEEMRLEGSGVSIPLAGAWKFRTGKSLAQTGAVPVRPEDNPYVLTGLYNGMIAPIVPYGIKGAIWYQGEANANRPDQYRRLLPAMIKDWRTQWGQANFPFLIVQLAGFNADGWKPDEWPELREAQHEVARTVPNTGLAVAIDIGDATDIHPKNKQDVGKRLALSALKVAYGRKGTYSGPEYLGMQKETGKVRLRFQHTDKGLEAKGGDLMGFEIAGQDGKFVPAQAVIEGKTVLVWSPSVTDPQAVRYGWKGLTDANLYNKAGLPAIPFRTNGPLNR